MSLILEALRKSEQQRRLGEVPTLGSPPPLMRRRRSLLPWLAGLIVIALGVGWWMTRERATTPPSAPVASVADSGQADSGPPAPATPERARPAQRKPAAAPGAGTADAMVESEVKLIDPGNQPDRPGAVLPQTAPTELTRGPRTPPPADATSATARSAPPNERAQATAPARRERATPAAPPGQPKPGATPAPANANPATATAPAKPAPATKPAAPALPALWELPYAVRKDVPSIVLTLHVYASDPAARFVVIDGERHMEGDTIVDDLILREIRPEGIVLEFHGQRFTWPRDGR